MIDSRLEFEKIRNNIRDLLPDECQNCGSKDDLHIHHIVPLKTGGTNKLTNMCILCSECHNKIHQHTNLIKNGILREEGYKKVRESGKWARGKIPYGYERGANVGEIQINEYEAKIIRFMYRLRYAHELSIPDILKILNALNIKTRSESTKWREGTVIKILDSDILFGEKNMNVEFPQIIDVGYKELVAKFKHKYMRNQKIYTKTNRFDELDIDELKQEFKCI